MTDLFSPLRLGAIELPNRVVMSSLTRNRQTGQRHFRSCASVVVTQLRDQQIIALDAVDHAMLLGDTA